MVFHYRLNVLLQLYVLAFQGNAAFGLMICGGKQQPKRSITSSIGMSTHQSIADIAENEADPESSRTSCFWKGKGEESKWEERIRIEDLYVGQQLSGHVVEDFLDGRTGPKLFFECGVGRTSNSKWSIVHGMLRLPKSKSSVAIKRAARLRRKKACELYVSRIQLECSRFEVCTTRDEAEKIYNMEKKRPISSLHVGEEVTGVVSKLLPYGAMVDVGANRLGLLHISTVAELNNKYIDKEKGLEAAGLERGANVRLSVASIEKRRLSLQFTEDVRNASQNLNESSGVKESDRSRPPNASDSISTTELASREAYATESQSQVLVTDEEDEDGYYDEEGDYDEDKDIEDSLGLGFY
ncbi:unnamed protein product [Cylindrotheca closterium]|uniref:S1 motif domain-containing protein n=1 Tax=Cylindrotheca closterium TaxID=2856 RepID=A0AAD2G9H2_9STRA|nr:unnamed protein product [Cylindrotheca closterium]